MTSRAPQVPRARLLSLSEAGRRRPRRTVDGGLPEAGRSGGRHRIDPEPAAGDSGSLAPPCRNLGTPVRGQSRGSDGSASTTPGRCVPWIRNAQAVGRAAAGGDPQPEQSRAPGRLRQGACRCGALQGGVGGSEPGPYAGAAGLAHALGAGRSRRSDRRSCPCPAILRVGPEAGSRTSRGCCPISALSYALQKRLPEAETLAASSRGTAEGGQRACARTSPSCSRLQGKFRGGRGASSRQDLARRSDGDDGGSRSIRARPSPRKPNSPCKSCPSKSSLSRPARSTMARGAARRLLFQAHDLDDGRRQNDDEEDRQEEDDHRDRELRRQRCGLLLRFVHPDVAAFLSQNPERLAERSSVAAPPA